jgi:hypothetical protein
MLTYREPGGEYKDFKTHNFSVADLMRILVALLTKDDLMSRFHRTNIMGETREDVELRSQVSHVLESNSILLAVKVPFVIERANIHVSYQNCI